LRLSGRSDITTSLIWRQTLHKHFNVIIEGMRIAADSHDVIEVRGARENNLADISLDIPKRRLTVFTGVSGSGKSSLVFGTIAAESRRLFNETYTAFVQSFMPSLARPEVDALRNLSAAIIVDQERMGVNARSTVGTVTDAYTMLRIVFSRLGKPYVGTSPHFSFNRPEGMCPRCEGLGRVSDVDVDQLVDKELSLGEGAITVPNFGVDTWYWRTIAESGFVDPAVKLKDYTPAQWEDFLYKSATKVKVGSMNLTYEGLVVKVQRLYLSKDKQSLQAHIRAFVDRAVTFMTCRACLGTRLNDLALSSRIDGRNIAECSAMQISDLANVVRGIGEASVGPLVGNLRDTLDGLVEIGLGYLSLDRESGTLSGGEAQRVKMVRHLGSKPRRRDLRVRRADRRTAPARHRQDERPPTPLARQGKHRARRGTQAGGHPNRRSRRRSRTGRRPGGRKGVLHRRCGRAARLRHADRAAPRPPGHVARQGTQALRAAVHPGRDPAQPEERQRRRAARRDHGGHRRRRVGQELTDPRLPSEV
jgi:hypothetical protein